MDEEEFAREVRFSTGLSEQMDRLNEAITAKQPIHIVYKRGVDDRIISTDDGGILLQTGHLGEDVNLERLTIDPTIVALVHLVDGYWHMFHHNTRRWFIVKNARFFRSNPMERALYYESVNLGSNYMNL